MKYVPTKDDCNIIRNAAAKEAVPRISVGAVVLEPGYRYNTDEDRGEAFNIALVSDDPDWNDTDLSDYGTWAEFRGGFELTPGGHGIVDFYIRRRGDVYHELCGNVVAIIENGKLVRVHGYGTADYFNVKGQ